MPVHDGEPELETITHLLTRPCFASLLLLGAYASSSGSVYFRVVHSGLRCFALHLFGFIDAGASV